MRSIVGRFADPSLPELLRLLTAASVAGELSLRNTAGEARVRVAAGMVDGEGSPAALAAYHRREGSFTFRPGEVEAETNWQPMEEFLVRLASTPLPGEVPRSDVLAELRETLQEVSPVAGSNVLVLAADPRPYRGMELDWQKRGWQVRILSNPSWPEGEVFHAAVFHLPGSATLAGQGGVWLELLSHAAAQRPPVPVIWVGGLADAYLRHEAVQRGAAFLLPGPAGEVGEAARWFREDVTALLERLLRPREVHPSGGALQEFFLALHADTTPEEARASLLRLAASAFSRGVLLACRGEGFEVLGGFGCPTLPRRLPRGVAALEEAVLRGQEVELEGVEEASLGFLLGGQRRLSLFPLRVRGEVAGILAASGPRAGGDTRELAAVAKGAGPLLAL